MLTKYKFQVKTWGANSKTLELQQGEVKGRLIEFQILDEFLPINLAGKKVTLGCIASGGTATEVECTITKPEQGICTFTPPALLVANAALMTAHLHVTDIVTGGVLLTTRQFTIEVLETDPEFEGVIDLSENPTENWVNLLANGDFSDGLTGWLDGEGKQFEAGGFAAFVPGDVDILGVQMATDASGAKSFEHEFEGSEGDLLYFAFKGAMKSDPFDDGDIATVYLKDKLKSNPLLIRFADITNVSDPTADFVMKSTTSIATATASFFVEVDGADSQKGAASVFIQWACVLNLTEIYGDDIPEKSEIDALVEEWMEIENEVTDE